MEEAVARLPAPAKQEMPEMVTINPASLPRHTPNEVRLLKQMTGKTYTELAGEDAAREDQEQVMLWVALRRLGYEPTWEEAGDVVLDFNTPPADPTSGESSTSSPPSAGSGG